LSAAVICGVVACDEEHWNALVPPDGYYDPIWEIQTQNGKADYSGRLVHEFSGKYSISLAFENPTPVSQGYDFDELQMSCTFSVEGVPVELPCGTSLLHYWGDRSGVSVALYSVPGDFPKDVPVELTVVFGSATEFAELTAAHGRVDIIVRKWSDL
jgi:hypothetical protein